MKRLILPMMTVILLGLVMIPACGGSEGADGDPLAEMIKAMGENPRFSVVFGEIDSKGEMVFPPSDEEHKIDFILPDRFYSLDEDAVDMYPYVMAIGNDNYVSEDGDRWEDMELWGGYVNFDYLRWNPYLMLKNARDPVDKGLETIDGKPCRVIEANVDLAAWGKDIPPVPMLSLDLSCSPAHGSPDIEMLKSLGYEVFQGTYYCTMLKEEVSIYVSGGSPGGGPDSFFRAKVVGASELTPELKQEFARIMESFGLKECGLEDAKPSVYQGKGLLSRLEEQKTNIHLAVYADEKSLLPYRMNMEWRYEYPEGIVKHPFVIGITYDKTIVIEKPENVISEKKAEALSGMVQDRSGQLQRILNAFKEASGVFPDQLDPETVAGILKSESLLWPTNPFAGSPMVQKEGSPGDYYYEIVDGGKYCNLTLYNYDGSPMGAYSPVEQGRQEMIPPPVTLDLTDEQKELALEIALGDPRVQELLKDREYEVLAVSPSYGTEDLVGSATEIRLKTPAIIEYDWPYVKYNEDGSFTEGTRHSAERVERLHIFVNFAVERIVEIMPF